MKKFLSFLIIILLQVSPVRAELFEIGKCFQLSLAWYPDITDKELVVHVPGKQSGQKKHIKNLILSKKLIKKNLKKITKKKNIIGLMMKWKVAVCISY